MRAVFGVVLIIGLGLAGFAVYMAKSYIGQYQAALAQERATSVKPVETVKVYVAKQELKYGQRLTPETVQLVEWPKAAMPAGLFTEADNLFAENGEMRYVVRLMDPYEPIMASKVTEPGEDAGLTSRLAKGMRAFAIKVDVASGVSGFLRPGDRVDVYWTGDMPGGGEVTKLIEAGVKLIAVDQRANGDSASATIARTVTVSATPQQVAGLAQAQSTGRLSLSLVGAEDDIVAEAIEVDQASLLGIVAAAPVEAPVKEEVCTIRTRRGAEVVEIPIPCTN